MLEQWPALSWIWELTLCSLLLGEVTGGKVGDLHCCAQASSSTGPVLTGTGTVCFLSPLLFGCESILAPEQGMYTVAFGHLRCPFQHELPDGQLRCVCPEVQDAATQSYP